MATFDIYEQYFRADHEMNGVKRRAAKVMLTAESGGGEVRYLAAVSFFPFETEDDFRVTYDDYYEKELFSGKGRRSKKRDKAFLETIREEIDGLAEEAGGTVLWDEPLREARYQ